MLSIRNKAKIHVFSNSAVLNWLCEPGPRGCKLIWEIAGDYVKKYGLVQGVRK